MNLEIAQDCINEEAEGYEEVTEPEIYEQRRWSTCYSQVYKNTVDETYWEISWTCGSTELQDEGPEDISFRRVFPKTKTVTVYE